MPNRTNISFVVPAYNVAAYIDECLQSIIATCIPGDQILLVDDGSTDGTGLKCRHWAATHASLITLTQQANQGLSQARNNGLAQATCNHVLFMDSDDVVIASGVQAARSVLAMYDPDILVMDFCWWHPEKAAAYRRSPRCTHSAGTLCTDRNVFNLATFQDLRLSACSRIFKRDLLLQLAPSVFPPGDAYEEIATVPRLTLRASSLYYLNEILFNYRVRDGSITQSKTPKHCYDLSRALTKAVQEVKELGMDDTVEIAANSAAATLCITAIRDCGLVSNSPPQLYEKTLKQGLSALTLPIKTIAAALQTSENRSGKKTATHLLLSSRWQRLYIVSRKVAHKFKRMRRWMPSRPITRKSDA